jgi:hypothetical protein
MTARNRLTSEISPALRGESVALSRILDASKWRHVAELEEERRSGIRVLAYPAYLNRLEAVVSTGNPSTLWRPGHMHRFNLV